MNESAGVPWCVSNGPRYRKGPLMCVRGKNKVCADKCVFYCEDTMQEQQWRLQGFGG